MAKEGISVEILGLEEIKKALAAIPKELTDKVLLEINKNVAKIAQQELQGAAPAGDNTKKAANKIENNVIIARGKSSKNSVVVSIGRRAFHARYYEKGTGARATKGRGKYRKGANRGSMGKRPFIAPSYVKSYPKMIEYFSANVGKILSRTLTRLQKRQAKKLAK
jgi:HK97 gp10 family phage protein